MTAYLQAAAHLALTAALLGGIALGWALDYLIEHLRRTR